MSVNLEDFYQESEAESDDRHAYLLLCLLMSEMVLTFSEAFGMGMVLAGRVVSVWEAQCLWEVRCSLVRRLCLCICCVALYRLVYPEVS